jgi:glutathione peroxidase-family protein
MTFYDFKYPLANHQLFDFSKLKGKVVLVVNTASNCGFANQFKGLEELYEKYKDEGFIILGFPCDQFGNQEPNDAEQAQQICKINYGVTFPIFDKVEVNGKNTTELYKYLKKNHRGLIKTIPWNFTKFLISKDGDVIRRFAPNMSPVSFEKDIVEAISQM